MPNETYKCRRGFTKVFDLVEGAARNVLNNFLVLDGSKDTQLFPECRLCKYGQKAWVLKDEPNPHKETYDIKTCKLRRVD